MNQLRLAVLSGGLAIALSVVSGCSEGAGPRPEPPAPEVSFIVVQPTTVPIAVSLGGRTVAFESSEVRPQVSGLIRKRLFQEGSFVRAGQPLYEIDDRLFRAAVQQAEANLASARATAEAAEARARRYEPLAKIEAISQQEYTDAEAQARQARASVMQSEAALETARINLRFANVTAPISGRIGRSLITTGALASASQTAPLAVIQRLDPIFVDMQQSSAELTKLRGSIERGEVGAGSTTVRLRMEDGSVYPLTGRVQFSDVTVEEGTGTVTLRASFPNPNGLLLPGMFVTAEFDQAVQPDAFLLPQSAVQRDFDGSAFVYVVGEDETALRRKVTAARTQGTNWVITDGLKAGERVLTLVPITIRQGSKVRPVPQGAPQRVGPPAGGPPAGGPPPAGMGRGG